MKQLIIKAFIVFGLISCSSIPHNLMRGNVAMKISETKAHICLGSDNIAVGDRVSLFKDDCSEHDNSIEGIQGLCTLVKLGEGKVDKVLNSHYSVVSTDGTFKFNEGDLVQKIR